MPVLPPPTAAPFDTLNVVLDTARARMNDEIRTLLPIGGKLLRNSQDFSLVVVNAAWWNLQEYLADLGDTQFKQESIIEQIPVVGTLDPAAQCWLSVYGYFDGANVFEQPALPPDLTHPLKVWERWSGQNMPFADPPMECMLDGIPNRMKWTGNRFWEWRQNAIWMPGSTIVEDLKIRYANYQPDFADIGNTPWFQQPVPVMRCRDAFAWFICAELAGSREDKKLASKAADFESKAHAAADRIMNRDVAMKQRINVRRQPRSQRGRGSWGWM